MSEAARGCSNERHDELRKSDVATWSSLYYVGAFPDFDDEHDLELRNCPCGSTVSRPVRKP